MSQESEIKELLEEFFERTCITDYVFRQGQDFDITRIKKKTPVGTWTVQSIELGYFIDLNDQVNICILQEGEPQVQKIIIQILKDNAKKVEDQ